MGGNALKVYTRRYDLDEYNDIVTEVLNKLISKGILAAIPKSYKNKQTFGDLDVLVKSSSVDGDILDVINELFKPNDIYNNSDVKSFDYKEFQIDFILTSDSKWETSINYFSYNDLGNFIGRISYQMGFRFGHFGLKLVYRHEDGGRKFYKIISKNPKKIYEFLGFDYERYLQGFDNVEDIFKFVVLSKYFNKSIFDYDQLNHQNRTRIKKRKNYELFLAYIKESDDVLPFDYKFKSKDYYLVEAEKFFNIELVDEINRWKDIVEEQKKVSKIFNGNVIMRHFPSLRGKELGKAMSNFNNHLNSLIPNASDDDKKTYLSRWILDNNLPKILEVFKMVNNLN